MKSKSRHAVVQAFCEVCGKEFYPRKQRVDAGLGRYCSMKCTGISQQKRGKENYTVHFDPKRNRMIAYWKDKEGNQHSMHYARMLMELVYGELPKGCEVHHKDGNTLNNELDNLEIVTKSQHQIEIHGTERKIIDGKSMRKCPRCGEFNIDENAYKTRASYCKSCRTEYNRERKVKK